MRASCSASPARASKHRACRSVSSALWAAARTSEESFSSRSLLDKNAGLLPIRRHSSSRESPCTVSSRRYPSASSQKLRSARCTFSMRAMRALCSALTASTMQGASRSPSS